MSFPKVAYEIRFNHQIASDIYFIGNYMATIRKGIKKFKTEKDIIELLKAVGIEEDKPDKYLCRFDITKALLCGFKSKMRTRNAIYYSIMFHHPTMKNNNKIKIAWCTLHENL